MTKSEQIAQLLGIKSTDVIVENDEIARHKDREWTEDEQELIADVFTPDIVKKMRAETKERIDRIADIIEKSQGQAWADDKNKIASDIRNQNGRT